MQCNVAQWDRFIRLLSGGFLMAWAIAGGPWWAYLGLVLIVTAAWRFCPVYAVLRVSSQRRGR